MPNVHLTEDSENPLVEIKGELNARKSLVIGVSIGILIYLSLLLVAYTWLRNRRKCFVHSHIKVKQEKDDHMISEVVEYDVEKINPQQLEESSTPAENTEKKKKKAEGTILRMAIFGGVKLILNTIICFYFTREWTDCGNIGSDPSEYAVCTETGGSCTLPDFFQNCAEDSCSETCIFGGNIYVDKSSTGCVKYPDTECVCNFWMVTTLTVIILNVVEFCLQLVMWRFYKVLDPQPIQFQLTLRPTNSFWHNVKKTLHPRNSLFSAIDIVTIGIAIIPWLATGFDVNSRLPIVDSTNCKTNSSDTLNLIFIIVVVAQEVYKPIIYFWLSNKLKNGNFFIDKVLGSLYIFRLDLVFCHVLIILSQFISLLFSVFFIFPFFKFTADHVELERILLDNASKNDPDADGANKGPIERFPVDNSEPVGVEMTNIQTKSGDPEPPSHIERNVGDEIDI
jgi:hypothetical protein